MAPAEGQLFSFSGGRETKYGFVKQVKLSGAKNGASGGSGAKEGERQKELKLSPEKFLQLVKITSCVLELDPAYGKRKWNYVWCVCLSFVYIYCHACGGSIVCLKKAEAAVCFSIHMFHFIINIIIYEYHIHIHVF